MKEIYAPKCTSNQGVDWMTRSRKLDLSSSTNMRKHFSFSKLNQGELGKVRMSREVFQTMTPSSEQPKRFIQVCFIAAPCVLSPQLNRTTEKISDQARRSSYSHMLRSNIVLQPCAPISPVTRPLKWSLTCLRIDSKLAALINRPSQPPIILTGIFIFGVLALR